MRVKRKTAAVALLLLLLLAGMLLSGCGGGEKLMRYEGESVNEELYRYWLCSFKSYFLRNFEDIEDSEECWSREMPQGGTVGEYVEDSARQYAENALCAMWLCREYGISLTKEEKQKITDYIEEVITYRYDGSRAAYNAALKETYGIAPGTVEQAYEIGAKITKLKEYLFGEGGSMAVEDADLDEYYRENYVHIRFIYFNTEFAYELNEDGSYQTDLQTGYYKTRTLTEEERAEKLSKAAEALARIEKGEDFITVLQAYGDMDWSEDYPDGFYLSRTAYTDLAAAGYSSAALLKIFSMEVGERALVTEQDMQTNYPGSFVIERIENGEKPYRSADSRIAGQFGDLRTAVENKRFNELLAGKIAEIEVNEELLSVYKIQNVKTGFSYLSGL